MRQDPGGPSTRAAIRPVRHLPTALVLMVVGATAVYAFRSILNGFTAHYQGTTIAEYTSSGTNDDCLTCHVPGGRGNGGNAYKEALSGVGGDNFAGIDLLDSDGDGVNNRTEALMSRTDFPTNLNGVPQVGYNPGLIDCPDGRFGYDPFSMQMVTGLRETPPGGMVWLREDPSVNCNDGLDNDCDGVRDANDADCSFTGCTTDAECDDMMFCSGAETCNLSTGECQDGTPPGIDDGIDCTMDFCDESLDRIVHNTTNALCDDTLFCNGVEACDAAIGCVAGSQPCTGDMICDEMANVCLPVTGCTTDADCDDILFCNGTETCNLTTGSCDAGVAPGLDDDVSCTDDFCDENADEVRHVPSNTACDDSLFCNGAETCDAVADCQPGAPPCATDQSCDEVRDFCGTTGGVDIDIVMLKAPRRVTLDQPAEIVLVVRNNGSVEGSAVATLTSTNIGSQRDDDSDSDSDPDTDPGDDDSDSDSDSDDDGDSDDDSGSKSDDDSDSNRRNHSRRPAVLLNTGLNVVQTQVVSAQLNGDKVAFTFRFPTELGIGNIRHVVTLEDGDPDVDRATAMSHVTGVSAATVRHGMKARTRGRGLRR